VLLEELLKGPSCKNFLLACFS